MEERQASHAEYSGLVLFKSTFDGELPAVEYPKINVCSSILPPSSLLSLPINSSTPPFREPPLGAGSYVVG